MDDTVAGVLAVAAGELPGPVNIGNPVELSMLELAGLIIELTGSRSAIDFIERPVDDPAVRCPDIALARDKLQWEPRVAARQGLTATIDWFRANPEA